MSEDRNTSVQDRHDLPDGHFRRLTEAECAVCRRWARINYKPGKPIHSDYHPITKDECALMNEEAAS